MSHSHISTTTMAIAESKKKNMGERIVTLTNDKPATLTSPSKWKNLIITLISLLLLGGGAFGAYYLYSKSPIAPITSIGTPNLKQPSVSSLVIPDTTSLVPIDGLNAKTIIAKVQTEINKPQSPNSILEIRPVMMQNESETSVPAPTMLKMMNIHTPDILVRSLKDTWMLGVYSDKNGQTNAFVIVTNNFFQNSFAGMLQWENMMPTDLKPYLASSETSVNTFAAPALAATSTTISTSSKSNTSKNSTSSKSTTVLKQPIIASSSASSLTVAVSSPIPISAIRGQFINKIISNKDVREYLTADGRVSFLYSFVDSNTLVLTGSESALSEILMRLEKQSYLR